MSARRTSSVLVLSVGVVAVLSTSSKRPAATVAAKPPVDRSVPWPVRFEPNLGQSDRPAAFLSDTDGHRWRFRKQGVEIEARGLPEPAAVRMTWVGSSADALAPAEPLPSRSHYFFGADPRGWQRDVPNFGRLRYGGVYDGIDVVFYGRAGHLEHDFTLAPQADPAKIRIAFEAAGDIRLDDAGALHVRGKDGSTLEFARPMAYQERGAEKTFVPVRYRLEGKSRQVAFELGAYDRARPLVIDPTLVFSTYVGGPGKDGVYDLAVDAAGAVYVAGETTGSDSDAFVAKFDAQGQLLYKTAFGGKGVSCSHQYPTCPFVPPSGSSGGIGIQRHDYSYWFGGDDAATGLAVDAAGAVSVVGWTDPQTSFPVTADAFQSTLASRPDGFLARLDASGALVYGSYLGGTGSDYPTDVKLDATGHVYVVGFTSSTDFPTAAALQAAAGGAGDGFVARFDPTFARLVFSTYLGGSQADSIAVADVDPSGRVHVAGRTSSPEFPTTAGALQTTPRGGADAFVAALAADGSALAFSTLLGASKDEGIGALVIEPAGTLLVAGATGSPDFPTTIQRWPFESTGTDFLARLSGDGARLLRSMLTGSRGSSGVAVDSSGDVYVCGTTLVTRLDAAQWEQEYSLAAPGSAADLALGPTGDVYVAGTTSDPMMFPTWAAHQSRGSTLRGGVDAQGRPGPDGFLVRFSQQAAPAPAHEEDHPSVEYEGTWSDHASAGHSGGRVRHTFHPAALARISFEGTGIQVFGYKDSASGFARVELDNTLRHEGLLDLYASTPEHRVLLLSITGLPPGPHRLVLQVADGHRNLRTTGAWIAIDGFTVIGGTAVPPLGPPPVPFAAAGQTVRVEETDPALDFIGSGWNPMGSTALTETGGTVSLTFEGEGVRFVTDDGSYINQWPRLVVDGELFWDGTAWLPRGRHTVTILQQSEDWYVGRWARRRLGMDAFEILGSRPTPTPSPAPTGTPYPPPLTRPSGTIDTRTPVFTWSLYTSDYNHPSEYELLIESQTGTVLSRTTHRPADVCLGSTCKVDSPITFGDGSYRFRVFARNAVGTGLANTLEFTVARAVPPAPVPKEPSNTDMMMPTYYWDPAPGANEYVLEVLNASGTLVSDSVAAATACTPACRHRPDLLLEEGTYTWRVRASNELGTGPWGSKSLLVTFQPPREAPRALSPSGIVDTTQPTFQWTPVANAPSYLVFGHTATPASCPDNVCSFTLPYPHYSGTHSWSVVPVNAAGSGPVSNTLQITIPFAARVEDSSSRVGYTGNWTLVTTEGKYSGGGARRAYEGAATASLSFEGIGVRWYGVRGPDVGIARLFIDGVLRATIDGYQPAEETRVLLFSTADLAEGPHTIRVEAAGTRNPSSTDIHVWLDYFETLTRLAATPTPTPVPTPARIENTDSRVALAGTWYLKTSTNHSGGSTHMAMDAGASASLTFQGTGVSWIGHRDAWAGIARVYIDGALRQTVDTYAASDQHRVVLFSVTDLPAGSHTIRVEVAGTRRPESGGNWVWVDAFDVVTGSSTPTPRPTATPPATATPTPTPTSVPTSTPPPTATPTPGAPGRIENTDPAVVLAGSWFLNSSTVANHSGGSAHLAMDAGNTATLTFNGTGIRWLGLRDPWSGIARVYIDGTLRATVDTYSAVDQKRATLYEAIDLAAGSHTLRIEVTGTKASASGGAWIWVDAFDVMNGSGTPAPTATPTLPAPTPTPNAPTPTATPTPMPPPTSTPAPPPPGGFVRVEQTSDRVTTAGTWYVKNGTAHSGGSAKFSMEAGDTVTFTFQGSAVRWIGLRDPWSGIAKVYIDGVLRGSVDNYNATSQPQSILFQASGLAAQDHTLRIEVTGTRASASGGAWIWVDAFEVAP